MGPRRGAVRTRAQGTAADVMRAGRVRSRPARWRVSSWGFRGRVLGMAASLSPLLTLLSLLSGPWLELGQCAGLPDCPLAPFVPGGRRKGVGRSAPAGKESMAGLPASCAILQRPEVPPRGGQLGEVYLTSFLLLTYYSGIF